MSGMDLGRFLSPVIAGVTCQDARMGEMSVPPPFEQGLHNCPRFLPGESRRRAFVSPTNIRLAGKFPQYLIAVFACEVLLEGTI